MIDEKIALLLNLFNFGALFYDVLIHLRNDGFFAKGKIICISRANFRVNRALVEVQKLDVWRVTVFEVRNDNSRLVNKVVKTDNGAGVRVPMVAVFLPFGVKLDCYVPESPISR